MLGKLQSLDFVASLISWQYLVCCRVQPCSLWDRQTVDA